MTFRFNYNQFTANDAGRKLVCVSATSDYFTVGKTYIIKMDGNSPCLITDDGQHLHATGSEFEFYHGQNLTPKQPKVGEIWTSHIRDGHEEIDIVILKVRKGSASALRLNDNRRMSISLAHLLKLYHYSH